MPDSKKQVTVSEKPLSKIFKAYDVRGIYPSDIDEKTCENIGGAFATFLGCKEVIVGTDMRVSSPALSRAFMKGCNEAGADVIDIGQVSTDGTYFASGFLGKPAVMFTASHNPRDYNGMKFSREKAVPINGDTGLQEIKAIIEKNQYKKSQKKGKTIKKDILPDYVKHVHSFIDLKSLKKLKIAVDAGNGMAGKVVPLVYEKLAHKILPLYFELDGNFPNHPADPSKFENLKDLQAKVRKEKADFGMAFDGDADRIFFADEKGEVVNSSLISALICKNMLGKNAGAKIIHNAVTSRIVPDTIKKFGGKVVIERVGHSFIKDTMRKTGAVFACEHSAHYYFRDNFNADSGIIASVIIAEIVSKEGKKLSGLLDEFRVYATMEETNFEVKDKKKKMNEIEKHYKKMGAQISKLDGVSVAFDDYWFNVRPSNTEPLLRLNMEALESNILDKKMKEITKIIKK